jgi:hypothetical protein
MRNKGFLTFLAILLVFLTSGCAVRGGRWVVSGLRSVATTPNTIVNINNRNDMFLEVRVNSNPVTARNPQTGEEKIAYIPPRGSANQGFQAFVRYYEVSITVVGHCAPDSQSSCVSGRMASRQFQVSADGTYQRVFTWDVDPGELR